MSRVVNQSENPKEHFDQLFLDVSNRVAASMAEIRSLHIDNADGQRAIAAISEQLDRVKRRFDAELDLLQENAEWERFTMAFFGETNAGKSTIIESLRILFNEESRQRLLEQNDPDLQKYEVALNAHIQRLRDALSSAYEDNAVQIALIHQKIACLGDFARDESSGRMRRRLAATAMISFILGVLFFTLLAYVFAR